MFSGPLTGTRRVALVQAILAPVVALVVLAWSGNAAAVAALYGAVVALAVSLVLVGREWQAIRHPEWDQRRLLKQFVRTGLERLVVLVGLLVVGLWALDLRPLPLLLGLVLAQVAWAASLLGRK